MHFNALTMKHVHLKFRIQNCIYNIVSLGKKKSKLLYNSQGIYMVDSLYITMIEHLYKLK